MGGNNNNNRNTKKVCKESQQQTCIVCNITTDKYKCPKCFMRYCSIACYRTHKESCSNNNTKQDDNNTIKVNGTNTSTTLLLPNNINNNNNLLQIMDIAQMKEKEGWKMTKEMKDNILRHKSWVAHT